MISTEKKKEVIKSLARHKSDVGSPEVQIGILTKRIGELSSHLDNAKKDHMARRGLLQLVSQRKKLLRYLASTDSDAYMATVRKLQLRK